MEPTVDVATLTVGLFASNCHIVTRRGSAAALVIDPGDDAPAILDHLHRHHLTVAAYLVTHGHMDHVSALAEVSARFPAPIGMHPSDSAWAFTRVNSMPPYYDTPAQPARIDRAWREGLTWTDDGLQYAILETPGHSPGSVSFHFAALGLLFSGDALFAGSIGRTDLPGGDAPALGRSLRRLLELPDTTTVYPGHGPATTIGDERRKNPFLRDWSWSE